MTGGFGQDGFGDQQGAPLNNSVLKIITDCLVATGINPEDEDYRARVLVFLNNIYLNRLKARHWKFTQREAFLDLQAPYVTGDIAVTQGAYDVAAADPPGTMQWDTTMVGQMFIPDGSNIEHYRILTVPTLNTLTLSAKFSGDTITSAGYKILFDRLTLEPGILAIRSVAISGLGEIRPVGTQQFRNIKAANPGLTGTPRYYTLINAKEQSGDWTIEFYPSPDKRYTAQVDYSVRPVGLMDEDDCYTLVPPHHMDVLHYGVLAEIYRYQENPTMLADCRREAARAWQLFSSDQEMTDSVARIQKGRDYFNRGRRYEGYYGLQWFGKVEA